MSRVGKLPVEIPSGVNVKLTEKEIVVSGKLGELREPLDNSVKVSVADGKVIVVPASNSKRSKTMWGTLRNKVKSMVLGVSEGFSKRLEMNGVGYRSACDGSMLSLVVGYSHEIRYALPKGVTAKCEKPTLIVIFGASNQLVGQVASEIMAFRSVEPYKGKGIYVEGSYIRRKEGKKK